jgi:serine/threonine-protein kinase
MGSVWRAEHLTLGTPLAIKLIDSSIAESPEAVARFKREAQSAAELRSVHVVQIIDYGVDDGVPFIAMELLDGESLAARLDRHGKLSPTQTADILSQVARALVRAHAAGIVHRDLKPENIYLVPEGEEDIAKVLDFGIAKKLYGLSASSGVKTGTGAMLGTPYYMSPEQALGQTTIDHRTDIWSLGIIAYQCLTGVRPFDRETLGALLMAICNDALPVPSTVKAVPPGFDAWFACCAARNPAERFASVAEATAALKRLCGDSSVRPSRDDIYSAAPAAAQAGTAPGFVQTAVPSSVTIPGSSKRSRRGNTAAIGAVVMFTVGLVFVARSLLQSGPSVLASAAAAPEPPIVTAVAPATPNIVAVAPLVQPAPSASAIAPDSVTAVAPSPGRPNQKTDPKKPAVATPAAAPPPAAPKPPPTSKPPAAAATHAPKHNYETEVGI